MSKDKKKNTAEVVLSSDAAAPVAAEPAFTPVLTPATPPTAPSIPAPMPKLMDVDKLQLDLAKEKRSTALAEAKTALANNEKAELSFKYVVLQIYMKYGLTDADAISETGEIVKNGAIKQTSGR
jgi:hypothetical protein